MRLRDTSDIVTGRTPPTKRKELFGGEYPFITPTDINPDSVFCDPERGLSDDGFRFQKKLLLPKNTICYTCIASIGKSCITKKDSFTNQQINALKVYKEKIHYLFLFYKLKAVTSFIDGVASGTTAKIISKKKFEDIKIKIPKDIKEQKKIAEILETVDKEIEKIGEIVGKLEILRRGLMQDIFADGEGKGWEEVRLGDVLTLNYGKSLLKKNRSESGFPVYGSAGIIGFHEGPLISDGGIIIGRKGSVGAVYRSKESFYPIDTSYYIAKEDTKCNLDYLFYILSFLHLERLNFDSAVPGLNREVAYNQKIFLPPLSEQKKIAEVLTSVDEEIEAYRKEKEKAEELKKGLMQDLLTGRVRVDNRM